MNTVTEFLAKYWRTQVVDVIQVILMCGILFSVSQATLACSGGDYERTLEIVNYTQQVGVQMYMTGNMNMNTLVEQLQEITQLVQQLPPSCQMLIRQINSGYPSGNSGTQCGGGVCCDSTGCY